MGYNNNTPPRYWNFYAAVDRQHNNGFTIPKQAYFVVSGSIDNVVAGTTGSVSFGINSHAVKLKRFEAFHSGSSSTFDVVIESSSPNTGSFYDPRDIVVTYKGVNGSVDYTCGLDQIEDLVALTDISGNLYVKFIPNNGFPGTINSWKYLIFFESAYVFI